MVELLEPGTEAETCLMAGRGMNGLRGVIVCYNPHLQRYTLELEKGDTMSLRVRNVRGIAVNTSSQGEASTEDLTTTTTARHEGGTHGQKDGQRNHEGVGSSLPGPPPSPPHSTEENDATSDNVVEPPSPTAPPPSLFESISPVNAVLVGLVAYFYLQSRCAGSRGRRNNGYDYEYPHGGSHHSPEVGAGITWPIIITTAIYAYVAWDWGTKPRRCDDRTEFRLSSLCLRLSFADAWEILGLVGLLLWCSEVHLHNVVSVGLLVYFGWKFGTRDGNRSFSFGNMKASLSNLSIWEAWMLAGVVESGLGSMTAMMARPRRR